MGAKVSAKWKKKRAAMLMAIKSRRATAMSQRMDKIAGSKPVDLGAVRLNATKYGRVHPGWESGYQQKNAPKSVKKKFSQKQRENKAGGYASV